MRSRAKDDAEFTELQARFVEEYPKDLNGGAAAIRAGYSKVRAKQQACILLKMPKIAEAVQRAIAERSERTKIDADWVLARLAAEAEADLADLYTADGALKPVHEWPEIWRKGLVASVKSVGTDSGMTVAEVKLSDRTKRIELLGKHVGVQAFREKVELTGANGAPLQAVLNVTIGGAGPKSTS